MFTSVFSGVASAASSKGSFPDAVLISPKDYDNCKLYSEPDTKKIFVSSTHGDSLLESSEYYADMAPVVNKSDNSRWYKIIYFWGYAESNLKQVNKLAYFNKNFVYVRADDVTTSPIEDYVKKQIDWLRAGRPPQFEVGDAFEYDEWRTLDNSVVFEFTASATLLAEPKEGARAIEAPEGLKCLGPVYATEDSFPNIYANMEEEDWALIVDVNTGKVLGWMKPEQLREISRWIEPDIFE
jgi:hypothetical protein